MKKVRVFFGRWDATTRTCHTVIMDQMLHFTIQEESLSEIINYIEGGYLLTEDCPVFIEITEEGTTTYYRVQKRKAVPTDAKGYTFVPLPYTTTYRPLWELKEEQAFYLDLAYEEELWDAGFWDYDSYWET